MRWLMSGCSCAKTLVDQIFKLISRIYRLLLQRASNSFIKSVQLPWMQINLIKKIEIKKLNKDIERYKL